MNDDEFLSYCLIHSETERHLFSGEQCRRLLTLAGEPAPELLVDCCWYGMDRFLVGPLVSAARGASR